MNPNTSSSTFNLEGEPESANVSVGNYFIEDHRELALGPLTIEPLASLPSQESGPDSRGGNTRSAEPGSSLRARAPSTSPALPLADLEDEGQGQGEGFDDQAHHGPTGDEGGDEHPDVAWRRHPVAINDPR